MIDPFDSLLNQLASVLVRDVSGSDAYGQANPSFTTVATGIPCRVSTLSVGTDREYLAKSKEDIAFKKVYMRPWFDGGGKPLTHDHWLEIVVNGNDNMYDIFEIRDPGGMGHHLEVLCRLVIP